MSSFRDILYRDYSASFGAQKMLDAGVQHAQYEAAHRALPPDKRAAIVDLGCGKGEWLGWMASRGYSTLTGVDVSESDIAIARREAPSHTWVQQNGITFLESQSAAFDLIHAKDVVEHMTKDEFIQFLLAAQKALRPRGALWLLTFNAQSPLSAATRYGDFTHEIGLTPSSAAQCLRACGFMEISVQGRHYCSGSAAGRVRLLLGKILYRAARLILKIRHGGQAGEGDIDLHCAAPDLFISARKP
jgi:cyclopropane fatty-acyl-phospholipid synthase-like methyltransferase